MNRIVCLIVKPLFYALQTTNMTIFIIISMLLYLAWQTSGTVASFGQTNDVLFTSEKLFPITNSHLIGSIIKGEKKKKKKQVSDVNNIGTACQVNEQTSAD